LFYILCNNKFILISTDNMDSITQHSVNVLTDNGCVHMASQQTDNEIQSYAQREETTGPYILIFL